MSNRDKIIDSAMAIVREQGSARLTLDETARLAGISKGGVLYHFPSKDDLLRGMIDRLTANFDRLFPEIRDSLPAGPYRTARATILTLTHPEGPYTDPAVSAILAAAALNPQLLSPVQCRQSEWQAELAVDSPDPELAMVVCLAVDGQYFKEAIGLISVTDEERERLRARALALLDPVGGA